MIPCITRVISEHFIGKVVAPNPRLLYFMIHTENKKFSHLGSGGDVCMELRGGNGGAGGRFSRRGILGDTQGEPLLGDCWRA